MGGPWQDKETGPIHPTSVLSGTPCPVPWRLQAEIRRCRRCSPQTCEKKSQHKTRAVMGKAAGGVREAFLEDVAISRSSGSLPGPSLTWNTTFWLFMPLSHHLLASILCCNHRTPLTILRKVCVLPSLHGFALAGSSSLYRENSYSAFKTQIDQAKDRAKAWSVLSHTSHQFPLRPDY